MPNHHPHHIFHFPIQGEREPLLHWKLFIATFCIINEYVGKSEGATNSILPIVVPFTLSASFSPNRIRFCCADWLWVSVYIRVSDSFHNWWAQNVLFVLSSNKPGVDEFAAAKQNWEKEKHSFLFLPQIYPHHCSAVSREHTFHSSDSCSQVRSF